MYVIIIQKANVDNPGYLGDNPVVYFDTLLKGTIIYLLLTYYYIL